jgi:ribonuclease HI
MGMLMIVVAELERSLLGRWIFRSIRKWRGCIHIFLSRLVGKISYAELEWIALCMAVKGAMESGISQCNFLTDCKELVRLMAEDFLPVDVDWRAFTHVRRAWRWFKEVEELKDPFGKLRNRFERVVILEK